MAKYNESGEEMANGDPIEMPIGLKRPPSLHETIAMHVRSAMFAREMSEQGFETEEEANDFDVDGDDEPDELPITPYEQAAYVGDDVRSHIKTRKLDKRRGGVQNGDSLNGGGHGDQSRRNDVEGQGRSSAADGAGGSGKRAGEANGKDESASGSGGYSR